jgi:cysteinyl-tRNA synthetase
LSPEVASCVERFKSGMDDDLNTAGAIGALYDLLTVLNRFADAHKLEAHGASANDLEQFRRGVRVLRELSQILGLFREAVAKTETRGELVDGLIQLLIDLRAECRKAKNFAMADQIRQRLQALGVTLEDRPGGTGWRIG